MVGAQWKRSGSAVDAQRMHSESAALRLLWLKQKKTGVTMTAPQNRQKILRTPHHLHLREFLREIGAKWGCLYDNDWNCTIWIFEWCSWISGTKFYKFPNTWCLRIILFFSEKWFFNPLKRHLNFYTIAKSHYSRLLFRVTGINFSLWLCVILHFHGIWSSFKNSDVSSKIPWHHVASSITTNRTYCTFCLVPIHTF